DVAPGLLHDTEHRSEAESRPAIFPFGGEERLVYPRLNRSAHAATGVRHSEHHVRSGDDANVELCIRSVQLHVGGLDRQPATVWHGIAGVHDQVHQDLLQLICVCVNRPEIAFTQHAHLDILTDQSCEHALHVRDHFIEIQDGELQDLLATECEELSSELSGSAPSLLDLFDVGTHRFAGLQLGDGQRGVAQDH